MNGLFNRVLLALAVGLLASSAAPSFPSTPVDYAVYPHLDHTEFLDGRSNAVAAYSLWGRDFFAVANENTSLHLFEVVADEVIPRGIGHTTGVDKDVAILDWHAFVVTGSGLAAVNIAVPDSPFQEGFVNLPGELLQIAVSATHAFVACERGGLVVVDITDPSNMAVAGGYAGDYVTSVCYDDGRLGIINDKSFELLDVAEPTSPALLGAFYLGYYNNHCVIQGDLAYVSNYSQTHQLDIADPASIGILQTLAIGSSQIGHSIGIAGSELIYTGANGLYFVNFATGTVTRSSRQVGNVRAAAAIGGKIMAVGDNRVEFFDDGIHENPSAPEVGNGEQLDQRGIILGDYLYGLSVADAKTLVATEVDVGAYLWWNLDLNPGGAPIRDMAHRDSTIVAISTSGTLSVATVTRYTAALQGRLDLSDGFYTPFEPDRTLAFLDDLTVVVLDQNYGAGRGSYGNVRVVDISDPAHPVQIGKFSLTLLYPEQIMVVGDLVLVSMYGGYEIFDAQDRFALQSKGVHPGGATGNGSSRFYTGGSHLYILLNLPVSDFGDIHPERLDTWDLSDPVTPVLVDQMNLASSGKLVFAGNWGYQGETGLVIDISDPAHPVAAANFSPTIDSAFPRVEVQAGPEYLVAEYRPYNNGPGGYTVFLPAQGAGGSVSAVGEDLLRAGPGLTLEAVPNPFNPRVTFRFELVVGSVARLQVFDLRGRMVADLGEEAREAGPHSVAWDGVDRQGRNLPSGVYLARISTPAGVASRKIVLAR